MAQIELITECDGVYPNGDIYAHELNELFLRDEEISVGNIVTKIQRRLKKYKPRWLPLKCQDIHNWLDGNRTSRKREKILRVAEKDRKNETLRWRLQYLEEDKYAVENNVPEAQQKMTEAQQEIFRWIGTQAETAHHILSEALEAIDEYHLGDFDFDNAFGCIGHACDLSKKAFRNIEKARHTYETEDEE